MGDVISPEQLNIYAVFLRIVKSVTGEWKKMVSLYLYRSQHLETLKHCSYDRWQWMRDVANYIYYYCCSGAKKNV